MKVRLFRVVVQGADEKQVLDDDAPKLLDVVVEIPTEVASRGSDQPSDPLPLQAQVRQALEVARPTLGY
jgi:hypothetical protein